MPSKAAVSLQQTQVCFPWQLSVGSPLKQLTFLGLRGELSHSSANLTILMTRVCKELDVVACKDVVGLCLPSQHSLSEMRSGDRRIAW